jgi:type IV pilus assembly protein PilQ
MKKPTDFLETFFAGLKRASLIPLSLISAVCLGVGLASGFFGCASTANDKKVATAEPQLSAAEKATQSSSSAKKDVQDLALLKIQDLSVREESGQTVLRLKLSKPITRYRHFPLVQPSRIVVDIFGDAKPQTDVQTFRVMTPLVESVRFSYGEGYVRLAADVPATDVLSYTVAAEDGGLRIVIGTEDSKATAKPIFELVKGGIRVDVKTAEGKPASGQNQGGAAAQEDYRGQSKRYTGQKLSLDFKDADIKNVFRLLAEVSGLNIVVTDEVNKKVTLRLIEVPWDQALDLLVDTNGLGKEQSGNVVRISTAAQLKSEKDALVAAQKSKEDLEPLQTVYYSINYAKVKDLESKIKSLQSKRPDAALVVDERSNTMMFRDIKKAVDDVTVLVAKLDLRTPQVLIESNLIETTPSFSRSLGLQFQFQRGGATFSSSAPAGAPFSATPGVFAPSDGSSPFLPSGLGGIISIFQNRLGGLQNLLSALQAAENEGNVKIISQPSVVTLNNVPSTIKAERILRIALPSSTNIASGSGSAAGTAVATEKIPVGVNLTVTPQVSSDGFVLMNIKVKSSSIANSPTVSNGTAGVVPFDELNREAEANVLVRDGETIVIGGILKDTAQETEAGVPYLKNIPVLGWLFKTWTIQKNLEELVVFITPRLTSAGSQNLPTAEQLWRDQMKMTKGEVPLPVSPTP